MLTPFTLEDFQVESNQIENIFRRYAQLEPELATLEAFLLRKAPLQVGDLSNLVSVFTLSRDRIRDLVGLDVRVGNHVAPRGDPTIPERLTEILAAAKFDAGSEQAYLVHRAYEDLHPYTDGNGRSGRALWLYAMGGIGGAPLGFLHHWYYQSLEFGGIR